MLQTANEHKEHQMQTRLFLVFAVLATAAVLPATALGKEIKSVTITGPGLDHQITLKGDGRLDAGTPIGDFAMESGFFPELFDTSPDPTLVERPDGPLGPKFEASYLFPNPETGELARVVQDVYPYAKPYPVTYVPAGRELWKGEDAHGGWYLARTDLKTVLVKAGLPRTAPAVRQSSGSSMGVWAGGAAGVAALLLAIGYLAYRRRTPASE
jgi:hypothetical protein